MLKDVGPLLKSYQEEIDRLTTRAKHGEAAFLDIYQRLYEAPDPAAALMAGLVRRSNVRTDVSSHPSVGSFQDVATCSREGALASAFPCNVAHHGDCQRLAVSDSLKQIECATLSS